MSSKANSQEDHLQSLLTHCKSLAIDIRKVRDVCAEVPTRDAEAPVIGRLLASHIADIMGDVELLKGVHLDVVSDSVAYLKRVTVVMVQLLSSALEEAVVHKLNTLNTALAGKVKTLHDLLNAQIEKVRNPIAPADLPKSSISSEEPYVKRGSRSSRSLTIGGSSASMISKMKQQKKKIDMDFATVLVKQIKEKMYDFADAYKAKKPDETDDELTDLIDKCKHLCSLGEKHDPLVKKMVRGPLKKLDKGVAEFGNDGLMQTALKELHKVVKEIILRYREVNAGRSPGGPLGKSKSAAIPGVGGRRRATVAGQGMLGHLQEVQRLVGDNSKRDPTELLTLVKEVGKGAFGVVWKAQSKNNETFAVKLIPISIKTLQTTITEIKTMRAFEHRNTLRYYSCYKKDAEIWIVMEFCDAGSVQDILEDYESGLAEDVIASICTQVLEGLKYLHNLQKIHRDIKSGNLLLTSGGDVKIADFGTTAEGDVRRTTVIGSSFWIAPEVIDSRGHDLKADVWSLGITLIEMAQGKPPYFDLLPHQVGQAIMQSPPPSLTDSSLWSQEFQEFLRFCLQKDPRKRFATHILLTHPWIKASKQQYLRTFIRARLGLNDLPPTVSSSAPSSSSTPSMVPPGSRRELTDSDVDSITSNIILPPVDSVDRIINRDAVDSDSVAPFVQSVPSISYAGGSPSLRQTGRMSKAKKAHSERRPSKNFVVNERQSQVVTAPPSSNSNSSMTLSPLGKRKSKIMRDSRRHSGKDTVGLRGQERIKVFFDGDEKCEWIWVAPEMTITELADFCMQKHYSARLSSGKSVAVFLVVADRRTEVSVAEYPYRIVQAFRKAKKTVHFLLREREGLGGGGGGSGGE